MKEVFIILKKPLIVILSIALVFAIFYLATTDASDGDVKRNRCRLR